MRKETRREFLETAGALAAGGCLSLLAGVSRDAAASSQPPNILFFYPDQWRFDWLGTNPGLPLRTPNIDSLAAQGVRFTDAVTPSPLCAPARACLASGKEYDRCRVAGNNVDYPLDQTTFYTLLRGAGYHVMGCGKFDLHKKTSDWGLDGKRLLPEWGFSDGIDNEGKQDGVSSYKNNGNSPKGPYLYYLDGKGLAAVHVADYDSRNNASTFPTPLSDLDYCDNWLANNGLQLLGAAPAGKPWFMQINFVGPHPPWDITAGMEAGWRGIDFPQPNGGTGYPPETYVAIRQNYAAMLENIDRWVGVFVQELSTRGELGNTLIVFSSDHGEMLGDHNLWSKSKPYHPSVSVPLIVWGPGVQEGKVSSGPASTLDLTATFLDYAGVRRPGDVDSLSMRPLLEGKVEKYCDYVLSGLSAWRMVYDGRHKLIRNYNSADYLFDEKTDPLENTNLIAQGGDTLTRLTYLLDHQPIRKSPTRAAAWWTL